MKIDILRIQHLLEKVGREHEKKIATVTKAFDGKLFSTATHSSELCMVLGYLFKSSCLFMPSPGHSLLGMATTH